MPAPPSPGPQHLSLRGQRLIDAPTAAEYIQAHFDRVDDAWDPVANPGGYISMCIAENKIVWDLLEHKIGAGRPIPPEALAYDSMIGSQHFREQLSRFLGRTLLGRDFSADAIAVLAGAGSVLELLFYVLCDPGDGVLVPTPSYFGFWPDLQTRDGLSIIPVHASSANGFRLSIEDYQNALATSDAPVRALLLTNPSNPLGTVASARQLEELWTWAEGHGIHVVFDEIYALSVFGDAAFTSAASVRESLGDRAHIVWAFSKDFAASGLRCGVLVSENEEVVRAIDGLAYWACCSGDTQFRLGELVDDEAWVDGFVAENRARLGSAYARVADALTDTGISFSPSDAGFFLLADMRPFMAELSWTGEQALWRRILEETNVNLTPGADCHVGEPGFMRLCFASESIDAVVTGVGRLGALTGK